MIDGVLRPDNPPPSAYLFGRLREAPFDYWPVPVRFTNSWEHIGDCYCRWAVQAGYAGEDPVVMGAVGLIERSLVGIDQYWESEPAAGVANAGVQIIPNWNTGDQIEFWAPVRDEPDQTIRRTGHLILTVDPSIDFETFLNHFYKDDYVDQLQYHFIQRVNMQGQPLTPEEEAMAQKILDASKKERKSEPPRYSFAPDDRLVRLPC